ncbi:MAG: hypothetical protein JWL77_2350 [Chthonomonadaceae bacterium]|nr:hypothetical protein [Chthonomonadaceae bacterium]
MWTKRSEQIDNDRGLRIAIDFDSSPVSYLEILRCWQQEEVFRIWFNSLLAETPFPAFRWETPAIATATANRAFEFVVLASPGLAAIPDPDAFAEHFDGVGKEGVVEFANLRKDAVLIVPAPRGPLHAYNHIGAFVRNAPEPQRQAFWERVGDSMQRRLSARPVWLSTAGAGVSWLHVRLDDRPKYYGYAPYREVP